MVGKGVVFCVYVCWLVGCLGGRLHVGQVSEGLQIPPSYAGKQTLSTIVKVLVL